MVPIRTVFELIQNRQQFFLDKMMMMHLEGIEGSLQQECYSRTDFTL
jgi:hypothetical protein